MKQSKSKSSQTNKNNNKKAKKKKRQEHRRTEHYFSYRETKMGKKKYDAVLNNIAFWQVTSSKPFVSSNNANIMYRYKNAT